MTYVYHSLFLRQACPNTLEHMPQCADGHGGPLCSHCLEGFSRTGLKGPCYSCKEGSSPWIPAIAALLLLVLLVFGLYRYLFAPGLARPASNPRPALWQLPLLTPPVNTGSLYPRVYRCSRSTLSAACEP